MSEIISRADAKLGGLKRYFTGLPCKSDHISERHTINGSCCECVRIRLAEKYHANVEKERAKQKIRRDSDPLLAEKKRARRVKADPGLEVRAEERRRIQSLKDIAISAGEKFFISGVPCSKGHIGDRFVSDGKCRQCNMLACAARLGITPDEHAQRTADREEASRLRAIKLADMADRRELRKMDKSTRQIAIENGDKTYHGRECVNGHGTERYTSTGGCLECASIQSASDEKKAYDRVYTQENMGRIRERNREWRAANRELVNENCRMWRKNNPEKRRATVMNDKHRRRAKTDSGITSRELAEWVESQPKICYWCGKKKLNKYHVDHYYPLSKGGAHAVSNLVIACPRCNLRKSAKDPIAWANENGKLL